MPGFTLPIASAATNRVKSAFTRAGVTATGTDQFLKGQIVSSAQDRTIIAVVVGNVLAQAGPDVSPGTQVGKFFSPGAHVAVTGKKV